MIARNDTHHFIRCEVCGVKEMGPERYTALFLSRMKILGWSIFKDGRKYDAICPDCISKQKGKPTEIRIIEG